MSNLEYKYIEGVLFSRGGNEELWAKHFGKAPWTLRENEMVNKSGKSEWEYKYREEAAIVATLEWKVADLLKIVKELREKVDAITHVADMKERQLVEREHALIAGISELAKMSEEAKSREQQLTKLRQELSKVKEESAATSIDAYRYSSALGSIRSRLAEVGWM